MAKIRALSLDLETYSSIDLAKSGVYKYCSSPDFEILLFGYAEDGGSVQVVDLACGEKIPSDILAALTDDTVIKFAHNSSFERICLSRFLGFPTGDYLNPVSWRCTMVWTAYMGLPLSLRGAGAVLSLEKQKLTEGKDLIRYFCLPCNPTVANGGRTRNLPTDAPAKWSAFKAYNLRDVETEMSIQQKLSKFPVPDTLWDEYHLDQKINDRGIALDMTLVRNAIVIDERSRAELMRLMQELTELDNPNSVMQMKQWLSDNGLETDTLGKKVVAELLKTVPQQLGDVLALRQQLAKSSVKKYTAMENAVCADSRARGMVQFYGANRTGRWAGRLIQIQNLPQCHLLNLEQARELVRAGNFEALEMLYNSVPEVLSELIRTAFIPREGCKFIVADFSSIERVVLAWLAGEKWVLEAYAAKQDLYMATASQMFGVPLEQITKKSPLRQKGKVADLACIAKGQLVLTDSGLVPIEEITIQHKVWDGEEWVSHHGVIYRGEREVIEYDGLVATPDHLVWVVGQPKPVQLGAAATARAHLVQTGAGRREIRLGGDHRFDTPVVGQEMEQVLCANQMHRMRSGAVDTARKFNQGTIKRVPTLFTAKADTGMARPSFNSSKTAMRESKRCAISPLWSKRDPVQLPQCDCSRIISDQEFRLSRQEVRNRPHQQQWPLRARKYTICNSLRKQLKQTDNRANTVFSRTLALLLQCRDKKAIDWPIARKNHSGCGNCSVRETKELENHKRKARLYDIRNAGRNHRFTVSGRLVHNCGYGGSVGALKAMGALEMGVQEAELQPLVKAWRQANPNIVRLWWEVDRAVKESVKEKKLTQTHGIQFQTISGMLLIQLPSGRKLAYVKPRIGENRFSGDCVTYEGVGATKKWERIESYGPKFVENIIQAIARDILCEAMQRLNQEGHRIVMHVHDEVVLETPRDVSIAQVCATLGCTPEWAPGLVLRADGFQCDFYKKD